MLANLLPGLRDLRAPLSAGFVWLLAGYLWLAPKIESAPGAIKGIMGDLYKLYEIGGTALLVPACAFAAYLIGVVSANFINPITNVLLKPIAPVLLVIYLLPALALCYALTKLTKRESFQQFARSILEATRSKVAFLLRLDLGNTAKRLALDTAVTAYRSDSRFREAVKQQLTPELFEQLVRQAERPRDYSDSLATTRYRTHCRQIMANISAHPDRASEIFSREAEHFEVSALHDVELLGGWLSELAYFSIHADIIERELKYLPAKLVTTSAESYERWDRLTGESEFRAALVGPLMGLGLAMANRGFPGIAVPVLFLVSWIIWASSRIRKREALLQLSQCMSGGVITSPELDRIREGLLCWKPQYDGDQTTNLEATSPATTFDSSRPSRLPSTRPPGERAAARPATSSGP